MKCEEFKNNLADIFDKNPNAILVAKMTEHMSECDECREEYNEIKSVYEGLQIPDFANTSHSDLKSQIINELNPDLREEENKMKKSTRIILKSWHKKAIAIAASIAIIISIFVFTNNNPLVSSARAAETIMLKSITAMESLRSMFISMDVRSEEGESFDLIGEEYDFMEYKFWKQFSGYQPWKVEKPGRIVAYDGEKQYLYLPKASYALTADEKAGFVEWMKLFFNPKEILEKEIEFSKNHHADYKVDKTGDEIILSITANALGDFHNNYLKNTSILSSDNSRVYTFDKNTMLLKTFELFINADGHSTKVIRINNIAYNIPIDASTFEIKLPAGLEWRELKDPGHVKAFTNISSRKAAKKFFTALHDEDWETIEPVWDALQITDKEKLEELKSIYGGLEIISIGEAFKSGLFPGEFVPYKVKLKSGEIAEYNLALRNDNPTKTWEIDGGL